MIKDYARQLRKGNNMWWITAFAVLGSFLCVGSAMFLKYFSSFQPAALPTVQIYSYSTPTSIEPNAVILTVVSPQNAVNGTMAPVPISSVSQPTATSTSFSFFNWIFPGVAQTKTPTPTPYGVSTPIQAFIIPTTPTNTPFPSPPPQPSPNPNTCKNVLYPARPGSQWTYYVDTPKRSGEVNMRVIAVDGLQATVDAVELNTGATARTYVQCDQDIILNFPLLSGQKAVGEIINGNGTMSMDYIGGVLAPNEAAFVSSNWALSWTIQYRIYGNGTANFKGRDLSYDIAPSTVQMTCQTLAPGAAAFEVVTVSAGAFNALKVVCRGDGQVAATVNGSQVTGQLTAQATQWFAPNIGLLKSQSDYAYLNVFGISFPLSPGDISGYFELRSYAIGH
jgi:hypothetical protein